MNGRLSRQGGSDAKRRKREAMETSSTDGYSRAVIARQSSELLELFYAVHYRGNMALADAMRGELTRTQAAILWLIRSESDISAGMPRKEIVSKVQDWFELTSSGVTRALRGMMRPPLALVRLAENAESGREKTVFLTAKGERFLNTMVTRGLQFLQRLLGQTAAELSSEEVDSGIKFLRVAVSRNVRARDSKIARPREMGARGIEHIAVLERPLREEH
jgi:DNA-binding MarR family transcriptional regulator